MKIKLLLNDVTKELLKDLDILYKYYIDNKEEHLELVDGIVIDHILMATYLCFYEVPIPQLNKVYVDQSNIEGLGVFAKENIKKGEIVTIYPSDAVRIDKGNEYYQMLSDRTLQISETCAYKTNYAIILGDRTLIKDTNLVGHIVNDHTDYKKSLEQNCIYYPYHMFILIVVIEDIKKDDELLVSYGVDYWNVIKDQPDHKND